MRFAPSVRKTLVVFQRELTRDIQACVEQLRQIKTAIHGCETVAREAERDRQEQDRPAPDVRVILSAQQGIETRQSREDAQNQGRFQSSTLTVQWALWGATTLAFIAAAIYAQIAYKQWKTMERTYSEIQKQTVAAQAAAAAAAQSANAAVQANNDARDRFRQDERPYLWLTNNLLQPAFYPRFNDPRSQGGQVTWDWHFVNYGKSPAYNVRYTQHMRLGKASPFVPAFGPIREAFAPPMPPNKEDWATVVSGVILRKQYEQWFDTDLGISIWVNINYSDAYGANYETEFCIARLQSGAITYCREHNLIK